MSPEIAFSTAVAAAGLSLDRDFVAALAFMLPHEGVSWTPTGIVTATGFADDPADPGGVTNWGVSLRFAQSVGGALDVNHDGVIDRRDIVGMTLADAIQAYRIRFWEPGGYAELPGLIGRKLFDLAVNTGPAQAHRIAQRAARAAGRPLVEDGVLGPVSRAALNACAPGELFAALRSEAAGFYRGLVLRNAALARFETGWLNRAYA